MDEINAHVESQGLKLREGTIVDATIIQALIHAPASTKNRAGERDPEMHQTKKGNQWHFGMKAHIGVDADTGIVHSMSTTAANAHDVTEAPAARGETVVWGDAGYQGGAPERRRTWGWSWNGGWRWVRGSRRTLEGSPRYDGEGAASSESGVPGAPLPEAEADCGGYGAKVKYAVAQGKFVKELG